jgi:hypothetical protein
MNYRRIFIERGGLIFFFFLGFIISRGGKPSSYLIELGLCLLILFAGFLAGKKVLLRFLPQPSLSPPELIISSIGLGLLFFSLVGFLLGLVHLLFRPFLLFIIILVVLYILIEEKGRAFLPFYKLSFSREKTGFFIFLFLLIAVSNILAAFSPVIFYDALVYHVGLPGEYLSAHRIFYLPYNMHGNLPQAGEMIYLFALIVKSGVPAKLLNSFFGLLSALTIYFIGRRISSPRAGFFSALIFYSLPQLFLLSSLVNVDFLSTFLLLLSLYFVISFLQGQGKMIYLSGVFAGFALAVKYQNLVPVALLAIMILILRGEKEVPLPFSRRKGALIFLGLSFIVISPWLIKNLIFTGNPVFPFFYNLFGGRDWGAPEAGFLYQTLSGRIGGKVELLPFLATFFAIISRWAQLGFHRFITPVAVLIPFFLIRRKPGLALLGIFGVAQLLIFAFISGNIANLFRYTLFAYALLFLCLGSFLSRFRFRRLASAFLIILVTLGIGWGIAFRETLTASYRAVFSSLPRDEYITRFVPSYPLMIKAAEKGRGRGVLFIGETRGFYAPKGAIVPSANNGRYIVNLIAGAKSVAEIEKRFKAKGIYFILIDISELSRLRRVLGYLRFPSTYEEGLFFDYIKSRKVIAQKAEIYLLEG